MKTVNKIIILTLITLVSCNKNSSVKKENDIIQSTHSLVDLEADSVYYKLSVGYENQEYYQDDRLNLLFLVTKEVYVANKNFGCYNKKNIFDAKKYSIEKKDKLDDNNVYLVTKISAKKTNYLYDTIWEYKSHVTFIENSYSFYELKLFLEQSNIAYNNKVQNCLNINFKTLNSGDGYILYTLNYLYKNKQWELVSREKICTIPNEINKQQRGYCLDTINKNCLIKANKFILSLDYITNLSNANCN